MSQQLIIKAADLVISPPKAELDVRSILHTLPQGKGWVFGLFTNELKDESARERVAHILGSHLEHLAADLADEANVVRRFEQGLSRINRDLSRAAKDLPLSLQKFNVVVGVVSGGQIFLSGAGKLKALFLHKTAERRFVIYELDAQFADTQERTWDKPLLAVLDGELNPGDVFYLGTPISHMIMSLDELQDVLVTLPPAGALQRIRQFLPPTDHFGGLTFQAVELDKGQANRKSSPMNSLQELETTKVNTASVLGDQQPDLVNAVKDVASGLSKRLSSPGVRGLQSTLKRALLLTVKGLSKLFALLMLGLSKLAEVIKRKLSESKTRRSMRHGVGRSRPREATGFMASARSQMQELSAPKKFAILGFMLMMVVVGGVMFIKGDESDKNKANDIFAETVQSIEDKILAAEASLIYRNTAEANQTLQSAAAALETLPQDTNEQQNTAARLAKSLATLQAKIRGVTLVEPTVMADLRAIEASASLLTATGTTGGIIALADNLTAYKLDNLGRTWLKQETVNGPISRIDTSVTLGADVIATDATQQLARLDLAALTLNAVSSGTNGMASVEDITVYNDTLYALTAKSQQIVRMRQQYPNFEAGTTWISAHTTDLTSARAIAIDSDVYILLANDVIKLTSGREQTWDTTAIDPPLANPLDLWTAFESSYLYILDPDQNRILVIRKSNGEIVAQYVSETFTNAVSFIVEEATSKITVITPTEALEFTPTHLVK